MFMSAVVLEAAVSTIYSATSYLLSCIAASVYDAVFFRVRLLIMIVLFPIPDPDPGSNLASVLRRVSVLRTPSSCPC